MKANQTDLINKTAEILGGAFTKKDIREVITGFKDAIIALLEEGMDVPVSGLATFKVVEVAERTGVNTLAGDGSTWTKPAHKEVRAKAAKPVKDMFI